MSQFPFLDGSLSSDVIRVLEATSDIHVDMVEVSGIPISVQKVVPQEVPDLKALSSVWANPDSEVTFILQNMLEESSPTEFAEILHQIREVVPVQGEVQILHTPSEEGVYCRTVLKSPTYGELVAALVNMGICGFPENSDLTADGNTLLVE